MDSLHYRTMSNFLNTLPDYPVKARFPEFEPLLRSTRLLALEAPTGSGKTTLLPLLMHSAGLTEKKILVTQPRRIAAKSTAARMSRLLGSPLGEKAGYRVRGESKVSAKTKIEVVTEGYALALLQADPFLSDYGWVILDEFHERHIDGDLLLSFLRDLRRNLKEDAPGIVAMTATWQGQPREALEEFSSFSIEGRLFPVEKKLLSGRAPEDLYDRLEDALREAILETDGKILVFLPGRRELEEGSRVVRRIVPEAEVSLLFGGMELSEQQRVLEYPGDRRQIILATAVAETSLTVEGVGAVIDSGLERLPVYLSGPGLTRLVTRRVSRATAEQRAGRAGRLGPGICYRLWSAGEEREMVERRDPEIISGELSRARIQAALWGSEALPWITPPAAGPWSAAGELLRGLGALDSEGRITSRGRLLAGLGTSPRLGHMVLTVSESGGGKSAAAEEASLAAAILSEGYRFPFRSECFSERLGAARRGREFSALRTEAKEILNRLMKAGTRTTSYSSPAGASGHHLSTGGLLSLAFPDRVGRRTGSQGGRSTYELTTGASLTCDGFRGEWVVFPEISGTPDRLFSRLYEPVEPEELRSLHSGMFTERRSCTYEADSRRFRISRAEVFGHIVLKKLPADKPTTEERAFALTEAVERRGVEVLPMEKRAGEMLARLNTAEAAGMEGFPSGTSDALAATMIHWLGPWLRDNLTPRSVTEALEARLSWEERSRLDAVLPVKILLRPGHEKRIDYSNPGRPKVSGRMQEFYGLSGPVTIGGGKISLAFELLSPAMRPLQTTADLEAFWEGSYKQIRGEMRGRYPKHFWPEDPATAPPSLATGKRRPEEG